MIESKIRYLEELRWLMNQSVGRSDREALQERITRTCNSIENDLGIVNKSIGDVTVNVTCNVPDSFKKIEDIVSMFEALSKVSRSGV